VPASIFTVVAFADSPFTGNPAGVCLLEHPVDASWMQHVAAEMNLAETAFVVPRHGEFDLRWFTPTVEMKLCGHATLASAHLLWETERLAHSLPAKFHTQSGLLVCTRHGDAIEMDFPAVPATPASAPPGLEAALGLRPLEVGTNEFDYLVEVASEAEVKGVTPDLAAVAKLPKRGVIVTARAATAGYDFVSRFFAPAVGVPEDPVTGSAHCALAPWWGKKLGKSAMIGRQLSPRGGTVRVRVEGDRVMLGGRAITMLRGQLAD